MRNIKSTIKYSNHGCTRSAKNPQFTTENILNRQFHADKPNEKWLSDVTEFKWYEGITVHKVYLSAILDLYDRRIVAYVKRFTGKNQLVQMIHSYIHYYNTRRVQRNLGVLTPMEKHCLATAA